MRRSRFPWRSQAATCREVARVLQSYLDGQVDDLTAQRVARHLEACRRCGLEARIYQEIKLSLSRRAPDIDTHSIARLRDFAARLTDGPSAADAGDRTPEGE